MSYKNLIISVLVLVLSMDFALADITYEDLQCPYQVVGAQPVSPFFKYEGSLKKMEQASEQDLNQYFIKGYIADLLGQYQNYCNNPTPPFLVLKQEARTSEKQEDFKRKKSIGEDQFEKFSSYLENKEEFLSLGREYLLLKEKEETYPKLLQNAEGLSSETREDWEKTTQSLNSLEKKVNTWVYAMVKWIVYHSRFKGTALSEELEDIFQDAHRELEEE